MLETNYNVSKNLKYAENFLLYFLAVQEDVLSNQLDNHGKGDVATTTLLQVLLRIL